MTHQSEITSSFYSFVSQADFPCVAAKDAAIKGDIKVMVAEHLACSFNDKTILDFIYDFINNYRQHPKGFHSAAVIFKSPCNICEEEFDTLMWQRLQALRDLDTQQFCYDERVSPDPTSAVFSYSLMAEAFFVLALHPFSSRPARRFQHPVLVFNPHDQFTQMKTNGTYNKMKAIVRKRDIKYSGSVNPMLQDFGEASEAYQYSGSIYSNTWQCPLKNKLIT